MTKEYCQYLEHHGIRGQKWGVQNGPPYPLGQELKSDIESVKEKAKNNVEVSLVKKRPSFLARFLAKYVPSVAENAKKDTQMDITVRGKKIGDVEVFKESDDSLNVVWIGIDKSARGNGYASAVMRGVIKHAKGNGYKKVTLEVPGNSPDARHIYEKLGFKATKDISQNDVWGGLTAMELKI